MNAEVKEIVREHLSTQFSKDMIHKYGLSYVKKEIKHAKEIYQFVQRRPVQTIFSETDDLWNNFKNDVASAFGRQFNK